jgi:transglutaminase-like putative cysteine protease
MAPSRYQVTHLTEYRYGEPVAVGHTTTRLEPRPLDYQQVFRTRLDIDPEPSHHSQYLDRFGNRVTYLAFDEPHDRLAILATSSLEVLPRPALGRAWMTRWEEAVAATRVDCTADGILARACRLDSPQVLRHPDLAGLAAQAFRPGRPVGEAAADLTRQIFETFEFLPGATDVTTPVLQVLAERRGVCQDFAHLLLGALRSIGLGARYVSGYLETEPPPGEPRMVGADASHAWVGLYAPGLGWVDLDPTNGLVQPQRHITIGWGRDYTDVAPVRGVVLGPPTDQELRISVDVEPIRPPLLV